MAPELTPLPPGSMTVPPLFGWQEIATLLVLVAVLGIAFLVVATARAGSGERSEWEAWRHGRSRRDQDPASAPQGPAADDRALSLNDRHGRRDSGVTGT